MTEYFGRIDAMLQQHVMPVEYTNQRSFIYCNDCEIKCWSRFHFLYHKCSKCNGYNTKVIETREFSAASDPLLETSVSTIEEIKK